MAATARKLVVEVVEARDLLPKDGTGTSSPYARADFDGQRRKTRTVPRDLNPAWNEALEFNFPGGIDPVAGEPLEVSILHDVRVGPSRRNNFLGRVRLDARQFVRKGEEALIYFPLEKKDFFSWVRGELGLKVYYLDEPLAPVPEVDAPPPAPDASPVCEDPPPAPDSSSVCADPPPVQSEAELPDTAQGAPPAADEASTEKPPEGDEAAPTPATEDAPVLSSEAVPASDGAASERPPEEETPPPPPIPTPMPRQVPVPPRPAPPPPDVPMERSRP